MTAINKMANEAGIADDERMKNSAVKHVLIHWHIFNRSKKGKEITVLLLPIFQEPI